jgi:rfaE bifunctional protein kinase chain/domain
MVCCIGEFAHCERSVTKRQHFSPHDIMIDQQRKDRLREICTRLQCVRVLVVGDVMLDHYSYGVVERISPEAPVPIISISREQHIPGGAGNVFLNVQHLGAQVSLIGVVGNDAAATILRTAFGAAQGMVTCLVDPARTTTVKHRLLAGGQQLLRVDTEERTSLSSDIRQELHRAIEEHLNAVDVICVVDYAKGVWSQESAAHVVSLATKRNIPVVVDTKPAHFLWYRGARIMTPNEKEVCEGYNGVSYDRAGTLLAQETGATVVVTRGGNGMACIDQHGVRFELPAYARQEEVRDVSGAGDTVTAAFATAIAAGVLYVDAADFASAAAAAAVMKSHTSAVTLDEVCTITPSHETARGSHGE